MKIVVLAGGLSTERQVSLTNGTGVLDQFIGKSAADGTLSVGSNVDAITGATVSTKGVTTGVNTALAVAGVIG